MKVCDVIHGHVASVEIQRADSELFPESLVPKSEVFLIEQTTGELLLQMGEDTWPVAGVGQRDHELLRQVTVSGLPRLCWFVQAVPTKGPAERILVQLREFPSAFIWNENVDFGVDDKIVDDMRKRRRRLVSVESVVQWLTETILLHPRSVGGGPRALLSGSPAADASKKTGFRIYGSGFAVDAERGPDDCLRIARVVEARRAVEGDEGRPIYLATGQMRFCDATVAGHFRGIARTELDSLVARADSYLGLWKEYNDR